MSDESYLMTVKEVAAALRMSPMTIYRFIHAGQLGAIRVGNAFRVPEAEYKAYVERNTIPAVIVAIDPAED